jgi:aminopeptidase N
MLRDQVGDEAFFTALNRYLKKNEYTEVEAHELRLAFEDVTGQDLNWFFNQWFFGAGHPILDIQYDWDDTAKKASVTIAQSQEGEGVARVFDLHLAVDIYDASGKARRENIRVTKRSQVFTFDASEKPALINVDANKALLCVKTDNHTPEELAFMYRNAPRFLDRYEAIDELRNQKTDLSKQVLNEALNDKHWVMRLRGLRQADDKDPAILPFIVKMAESDPEPNVRATAIKMLGETGDKQYIPIAQKGLTGEQPYSVVGASLDALTQLDPQAAIAASKSLENDDSDAIAETLAALYAEYPDRANLPFFEKKIDKVDFMAAFSFFDGYQKYLTGLGDPAILDAGAAKFKSIALNMETSEFRRFAATKAIADMRNFFREKEDSAKVETMSAIIKEIKEKETDPTLKLYYDMFDTP